MGKPPLPAFEETMYRAAFIFSDFFFSIQRAPPATG
jgi:hypothetical protein